jgi:hypothetical protein
MVQVVAAALEALEVMEQALLAALVGVEVLHQLAEVLSLMLVAVAVEYLHSLQQMVQTERQTQETEDKAHSGRLLVRQQAALAALALSS